MKGAGAKISVSLFVLSTGLGLLVQGDQAPGPARRTDVRADRILVIKSERTLYAMRGDSVLRSYRVAFGRGRGPKTADKDKKTPEGVYEGCRLNLASKYHKAILIPYPTPQERQKGYTGGDIEIHGLPHLPLGLQKILGGLLVRFGSTRGCVMLADADIDDLAAITAFPVTVEIRASREERGLGLIHASLMSSTPIHPAPRWGGLSRVTISFCVMKRGPSQIRPVRCRAEHSASLLKDHDGPALPFQRRRPLVPTFPKKSSTGSPDSQGNHEGLRNLMNMETSLATQGDYGG